MKIAIVAANGKAGSRIVKAAKDEGQDVTAIVRGENKTAADHVIEKDLFDLTPNDVKDFDVVVDAFGAWTPDTVGLHTKSLMHLADILSGTKTRLIVVGGAGSLYTNHEHTKQVIDEFEFPEAAIPVLRATGEALDALRKRDDVEWTYVSPAIDFQADGKKTGRYTLGGEELTLNKQGKSEISYDDYAQALVDEAIKGSHIRERISVVGEEDA